MFKQNFFTWLLLIAVLLGLLVPSCKKQDLGPGANPGSGTNTEFPTADRSGDPLSEQAFNEVVTDEYEQQGKFIYDHFRYRFATVSPESYIPSGSRQLYLQTMIDEKALNANKTAMELVGEYYTNGILNQNERSLFTGLHQTVSAMENDADLTFGEAWYAIRNWETATINNTSIPEADKGLVLVVASSLRNTLKFEYENGQLATDRGDDCFLGRKLSCWLDVMTATMLESLKAALKIIAPAAAAGNFNNVNWADVKKAAYIAGGIGLVVEIVKMYLSNKCKCDTNQTDPPVACATPTGISMRIGDCNTIEQVFEAFGYGNAPGPFTWVISNGYFPDFSSNGNLATMATTIPPYIKVHQNDPNVDIVLTVSASCNDEFSPAFPFSVPKLVNDPGTIMILGAGEVNASPSNIEKYEFWGSWKTNQNSLITYSGCTPHGQVQEQGADFIKVKWLSTTPDYPKPTITAIATNFCSNQSVTQTKYVIVH